jgi:protein TonB
MEAHASPIAARWSAFAIVLVAHAALVSALLSLPTKRAAFRETDPITVRLIAPPAVESEPKLVVRPNPIRTKPHVKRQERTAPAPIAKAAPEVPSAAPAPPSSAETLLPTESAPSPGSEPAAAAPPAPSPTPPAPVRPPATSAAPPQLVPPSFTAAYLTNPAPAYPVLSRRMGEEGKVILRVYVNEEGSAARIELRTSSGHPRLDEAAMDAVRKWKFVPARRADSPVGAWVLLPISFSLRS